VRVESLLCPRVNYLGVEYIKYENIGSIGEKIVQNDRATEILKQLGLNNYEIRAYLTLVSTNNLTATELSSASGVPSARVYDIMDSLERKGFVKIGLGRPTIYQAVAPEEGLSNYKRKMELEFDRKLKGFDGLKIELVKSLKYTWGKEGAKLRKAREMLSVKENDDILVTLEKMFVRTKKRLYVLSYPLMNKMLVRCKPMLEELADKGVEIRIIAPPNSGGAIKDMGKFAIVKETAKSSPSGYCLTDDELFLIECYDVQPGFVQGTGIWTNSSMLVKILEWSFDQLWETTT